MADKKAIQQFEDLGLSTQAFEAREAGQDIRFQIRPENGGDANTFYLGENTDFLHAARNLYNLAEGDSARRDLLDTPVNLLSREQREDLTGFARNYVLGFEMNMTKMGFRAADLLTTDDQKALVSFVYLQELYGVAPVTVNSFFRGVAEATVLDATNILNVGTLGAALVATQTGKVAGKAAIKEAGEYLVSHAVKNEIGATIEKEALEVAVKEMLEKGLSGPAIRSALGQSALRLPTGETGQRALMKSLSHETQDLLASRIVRDGMKTGATVGAIEGFVWGSSASALNQGVRIDGGFQDDFSVTKTLKAGGAGAVLGGTLGAAVPAAPSALRKVFGRSASGADEIADAALKATDNTVTMVDNVADEAVPAPVGRIFPGETTTIANDLAEAPLTANAAALDTPAPSGVLFRITPEEAAPAPTVSAAATTENPDVIGRIGFGDDAPTSEAPALRATGTDGPADAIGVLSVGTQGLDNGADAGPIPFMVARGDGTSGSGYNRGIGTSTNNGAASSSVGANGTATVDGVASVNSGGRVVADQPISGKLTDQTTADVAITEGFNKAPPVERKRRYPVVSRIVDLPKIIPVIPTAFMRGLSWRYSAEVVTRALFKGAEATMDTSAAKLALMIDPSKAKSGFNLIFKDNQGKVIYDGLGSLNTLGKVTQRLSSENTTFSFGKLADSCENAAQQARIAIDLLDSTSKVQSTVNAIRNRTDSLARLGSQMDGMVLSSTEFDSNKLVSVLNSYNHEFQRSFQAALGATNDGTHKLTLENSQKQVSASFDTTAKALIELKGDPEEVIKAQALLQDLRQNLADSSEVLEIQIIDPVKQQVAQIIERQKQSLGLEAEGATKALNEISSASQGLETFLNGAERSVTAIKADPDGTDKIQGGSVVARLMVHELEPKLKVVEDFKNSISSTYGSTIDAATNARTTMDKAFSRFENASDISAKELENLANALQNQAGQFRSIDPNISADLTTQFQAALQAMTDASAITDKYTGRDTNLGARIFGTTQFQQRFATGLIERDITNADKKAYEQLAKEGKVLPLHNLDYTPGEGTYTNNLRYGDNNRITDDQKWVEAARGRATDKVAKDPGTSFDAAYNDIVISHLEKILKSGDRARAIEALKWLATQYSGNEKGDSNRYSGITQSLVNAITSRKATLKLAGDPNPWDDEMVATVIHLRGLQDDFGANNIRYGWKQAYDNLRNYRFGGDALNEGGAHNPNEYNTLNWMWGTGIKWLPFERLQQPGRIYLWTWPIHKPITTTWKYMGGEKWIMPTLGKTWAGMQWSGRHPLLASMGLAGLTVAGIMGYSKVHNALHGDADKTQLVDGTDPTDPDGGGPGGFDPVRLAEQGYTPEQIEALRQAAVENASKGAGERREAAAKTTGAPGGGLRTDSSSNASLGTTFTDAARNFGGNAMGWGGGVLNALAWEEMQGKQDYARQVGSAFIDESKGFLAQTWDKVSGSETGRFGLKLAGGVAGGLAAWSLTSRLLANSWLSKIPLLGPLVGLGLKIAAFAVAFLGAGKGVEKLLNKFSGDTEGLSQSSAPQGTYLPRAIADANRVVSSVNDNGGALSRGVITTPVLVMEDTGNAHQGWQAVHFVPAPEDANRIAVQITGDNGQTWIAREVMAPGALLSLKNSGRVEDTAQIAIPADIMARHGLGTEHFAYKFTAVDHFADENPDKMDAFELKLGGRTYAVPVPANVLAPAA